MKALSLAIAAGALLSSSFAATIAMTSSAAVTLARVPHGGIQPMAEVDSRGTLHLLYFAGEPHDGNLFYVRSTDYGQTFSVPIRVNSQEGSAIATGTIRGGQLSVGRGGRVHVVWNGSDGAKPRGLINPASGKAEAPFLYSRSDASGTAFEPQRDLTKRSYGIDGGGSIAADDAGHVYAAWHALPVGGGSGEDQRRVWIARSGDDGATFGEEQPAWSEPTGACGCCGLRMFAGPSSTLYMLYRSATALTHRDMYMLESTDHGQSFRGSKVQPWDIGACPMTSMSITSIGSNVFGAWETAARSISVNSMRKRHASRRPSQLPATQALVNIHVWPSMQRARCCSCGPKEQPGHAEALSLGKCSTALATRPPPRARPPESPYGALPHRSRVLMVRSLSFTESALASL
jgi:hypothetical protein